MTLSTETRFSNRLPYWLRRRIPNLSESTRVESTIRRHRLHTVCHEALCPNRAECYAKGKVTFSIMGDICTRACRFCSVKKGIPGPPDDGEPGRLAAAVRELGLTHVIVTSVTRDDLPDGGASRYAAVIETLGRMDPPPVIEVLVPDFQGDGEALDAVLSAGPDIFSHNMETVKRLYGTMRRGADYERSLSILSEAKERCKGVMTKSALILGMGERIEEVIEVLIDLRRADCDFIAIGQYLRPGLDQILVGEYIPPETFAWFEERAYEMGFLEATAGPLVRSSYQESRITAYRPRVVTDRVSLVRRNVL
ncbi:MAG: lipoyl synthase [bacterium]|nr:MAG: lipoyl synthase [bacterium]